MNMPRVSKRRSLHRETRTSDPVNLLNHGARCQALREMAPGAAQAAGAPDGPRACASDPGATGAARITRCGAAGLWPRRCPPPRDGR
jgi:hypothetical protein